MGKVIAKSAAKTRSDRWAVYYREIHEVRKPELESMLAGDVLAELGRLVGRFEVFVLPAFDQRPMSDNRGVRDDGSRQYVYGISYEILRPGRPGFRCHGNGGPDLFLTLHAVAVWAVMGALTWLGPFQQTDGESE